MAADPGEGVVAALAIAASRRRLLRGLATALLGGTGALLATPGGGGRPLDASAASTTAGLAEAINTYRVAHGKPAIPISPELTAVAKAHVRDMLAYGAQSPYTDPGCDAHSWSTRGPWTGGCYNPALPATWPIMWAKPQELAHYPGNGYEELAGAPNLTATAAVTMWAADAAHGDVLLNQGTWTAQPWRAVGGWVEGGWAAAWFGEQPDPSTQPVLPAAPAAPGATGGPPTATLAPAVAPAPAPPPPAGAALPTPTPSAGAGAAPAPPPAPAAAPSPTPTPNAGVAPAPAPPPGG